MKLGYTRISTKEQKLDLQLDALKKAGCRKIFLDVISGAAKNRPNLDKMLEQLYGRRLQTRSVGAVVAAFGGSDQFLHGERRAFSKPERQYRYQFFAKKADV